MSTTEAVRFALGISADPFEVMHDLVHSHGYANTLTYGTFKESRTAYRDEEYRLRCLFESDLALAYRVSDHPKVGLLFQLAWDEGHSAGFHEVLHHYDKLVGLIK